MSESMIAVEQMNVQDVVAHFARKEGDTGSSEVQIALLTSKIKQLNEHFKAFRHDHHSRRGLIKMVARRRRLLAYLKKQSESQYLELIAKLGLRK